MPIKPVEAQSERPALRLDEAGREIPDDTPIVLRVKNRLVTNFDEIRAFMRRELSDFAQARGQETLDEANDFDIEDDPIDPTTPWEEWGDEQAEQLQKVVKQRAEENQALRNFYKRRERLKRQRQLDLQDLADQDDQSQNPPQRSTGNPVDPPPAGTSPKGAKSTNGDSPGQ